MEKILKVGIIGIGNMGSAHLACIYGGKIAGLKVTAICDCSPERREFAKANYPDIPIYCDADEIIADADIEAVIIATPHKFHADIAVKAFGHGLNVLVEKPADISVSKANMLNKAASKSGKTFCIMFNQRTNPLFGRARQIVQSGELGELKRSVWIITNWYRTQHYYDSGDWRATWSGEGGGVLLNQAPHNLDLWQWICGMPRKLTAFCDIAKYHDIEVEDDVTIFARYENGAVGTFITSTGEYPGTNRLEITGDLGKIVLENGKLKWWRLSRSSNETIINSQSNIEEIPMEYTELVSDGSDTEHKGILQNFTNACLFGEELLAPGSDGINELMLSNTAYLSSWSGNAELTLPVDADSFDGMLKEHMKKYAGKNGISESGEYIGDYNKRWQVRW